MKKPQSLLTHQSEADPVGYALLFRKINSIAHLKCEATDKQCEQAKKVNGNYSLSVHALTASRTWLLHVREQGIVCCHDCMLEMQAIIIPGPGRGIRI